MKIGIEAKWYFDGPPSGKMIIQNIVNTLLEKEYQHKIYLFLNKKYRHREKEFIRKNITPIFVWSGNNLISNTLILPFIIKKYNIDVVVYQNFVPFLKFSKSIAYVHDLTFRYLPEHFNRLERLYFLPLIPLLRFSSLIIAVSKYEKRMIHSYVKGKSISVVYHGISKRFFEFSSKKKQINDYESIKRKYTLPERYILFVGRINSIKNIDNLIRSLSIVKERDLYLVIVGDDYTKNTDYQKTIGELGLEKRIVKLGFVFGEDLLYIYKLASILCLISVKESFGLPALEAMSLGVPVVVSNNSALPEVCGDAGSYVDPFDPKDIASKIDYILCNEGERNRKVELGLERARTFSWDRSTEQIINICEQVVNHAS